MPVAFPDGVAEAEAFALAVDEEEEAVFAVDFVPEEEEAPTAGSSMGAGCAVGAASADEEGAAEGAAVVDAAPEGSPDAEGSAEAGEGAVTAAVGGAPTAEVPSLEGSAPAPVRHRIAHAATPARRPTAIPRKATVRIPRCGARIDGIGSLIGGIEYGAGVADIAGAPYGPIGGIGWRGIGPAPPFAWGIGPAGWGNAPRWPGMYGPGAPPGGGCAPSVH